MICTYYLSTGLVQKKPAKKSQKNLAFFGKKKPAFFDFSGFFSNFKVFLEFLIFLLTPNRYLSQKTNLCTLFKQVELNMWIYLSSFDDVSLPTCQSLRLFCYTHFFLSWPSSSNICYIEKDMKYSSSTEVNKGHRYQITKWQGPIVLKPHHPGSWAVMSLPENMDICNVIRSAGVGGGGQITVCIYYKNCYLFFPRCITDYIKNIPGHKRLAWRYSKGTAMVQLQDLVS